jgi:hypothetical protein
MGVCKTTASAKEIRIQRRIVLVYLMHITARGISLPEFDQGIRQWTAPRIEHAPHDPNPLAQRFAIASGVARKVAINLTQPVKAEDWY